MPLEVSEGLLTSPGTDDSQRVLILSAAGCQSTISADEANEEILKKMQLFVRRLTIMITNENQSSRTSHEQLHF